MQGLVLLTGATGYIGGRSGCSVPERCIRRSGHGLLLRSFDGSRP